VSVKETLKVVSGFKSLIVWNLLAIFIVKGARTQRRG
jgi:hypothetical protein